MDEIRKESHIEKEKKRKGGSLHHRPPLTGPPRKGHRGQAVRRRRAHHKGNARPAKGPATAPPPFALLGLLWRVRHLQRGEREKGRWGGPRLAAAVACSRSPVGRSSPAAASVTERRVGGGQNV
jgi:hypothetical protein